MDLSPVNTKKSIKGLESKKSHSWWWESHIAARNSKWLTENLEDMDRHYRRMLQLIEGEGDSLAKKADMYYQKRPELLSHAEELHRMYKLLADRYEHLIEELRMNLVPDLQSQGLVGSDTGSELTSALSTPDSKSSLRRSGPRAAGFDFFLGSGKPALDRSAGGDETSTISDSETESDVSSLNSYPGISGHIAEEVKPLNVSLRRIRSENFNDGSKIVFYEEELKLAKEKIHIYEEEIVSLKMELQKTPTMECASSLEHELGFNTENVLELEEGNTTEVGDLRIITRLHTLNKEVMQLRKERKESYENLRKMQDLLRMSQQEAATFRRKAETEKRQSLKLQERMARCKARLTEVSKITDEKTCLEEKLHDEIKLLREDVDSYKLKYDSAMREKHELIEEIERQNELISEGAEGKREAIRQLCLSLEHYRNGYRKLRQAFMEHKHPHVLASESLSILQL